jgi:hypothetical protein
MGPVKITTKEKIGLAAFIVFATVSTLYALKADVDIANNCTSAKVAVKVVAPDPFLYNWYYWQDQEIEGMKYRVYFGKSTGHGPNSIFVVNVTKDKLEVEALQKQLK